MSAAFDCPECGFPLESGGTACPKCGESWRGRPVRDLLVVDVAHSGETWEQAREKILRAVDRGVINGHRGVKIIHGYGAGGGGRGVIRRQALPLLRALAAKTGGKLATDRDNPGAHILWL